MTRSTGGEQHTGTARLQPFEGLVHSTARMFAAQVGREEDDLAQELRVRVWRAIESYDPGKATSSLERYVFSAIANKIKDFKRDAAREAKRRERHGVSFVHIEDTLKDDGGMPAAERFDSLYHFVDHDAVYGEVEDGKFVLPAGVTERESHVLICLMMQMSKTEIVLRLGGTRSEVELSITSLRLKFSDWQPHNDGQTVAMAQVAEAIAA